ncbi:MAG: YcgN family cysteine cluster protein [Hyphomicrobiaceae bacterium]|nr:MAG: YcgN family cysteine cluster protein [Hyphomicrobiaceae bacterium]
MAGHTRKSFWKAKKLEELDGSEWESLCDGCGRCCMVSLEDDETGERFATRLACRLLDIGNCRCGDYANRHAAVSDCVRLDASAVRRLDWLPDTCAYRLVAAGRDLAWWHPLVSGDPSSVHKAGVSVRDYARSEKGLKIKDYQRFIVP